MLRINPPSPISIFGGCLSKINVFTVRVTVENSKLTAFANVAQSRIVQLLPFLSFSFDDHTRVTRHSGHTTSDGVVTLNYY